MEKGAEVAEVLLPRLFPVARSACSLDHPGAPARGATTHHGLGPPTSIINQGNALQAFAQANRVGGIFLIDLYK